jgi:hypothetical protein
MDRDKKLSPVYPYNIKHRMGLKKKIIRSGIFLDNPARLLLK